MTDLKVIIRCDYNDADFVSEENDITLQEWERLLSILLKMKRVRKRYWPGGVQCELGEFSSEDARDKYKDTITEADFEFLETFLPYHENGIHSINEVTLREVKEISSLKEALNAN